MECMHIINIVDVLKITINLIRFKNDIIDYICVVKGFCIFIFIK